MNHCVGEVHQICSLNVHISLYFLISTEKPRLIPDNCRQAGSPDMVGTMTLSPKAEGIGTVAYLCFAQ